MEIARPGARPGESGAGAAVRVPRPTGTSSPVVLAAALATIVVSAALLVAETSAIRAAWPPTTWRYSLALPFVNPTIRDSRHVWTVVMSLCALWSVAYAVALRSIAAHEPRRDAAKTILGVQALLLAVTLASAIPFNSDQYAYVGYAELVNAGKSPYAPPPIDAPATPNLKAISTVWGHTDDERKIGGERPIIVRSRYGPLAMLGSAAILLPFGSTSVETQARILRVAAALAALLCTVLLRSLLRTWAARDVLVAAFALNPAIVQQTALGAHNDIFAVAFALAAAVALGRRLAVTGAIACAASLAVKLTFAPFVLAYAAYVFGRRGAVRGVTSAAAFLATLAVCATPFGLDAALLRPARDVARFNTSLIAAAVDRGVHHVAHRVLLPSTAFVGAYEAAIACCAAIVAFAAFRGRRYPVAEMLLVILIFGGAQFEPWYAIVLVGLLIVPSRFALPAFVGISLASQLFQGSKIFGEHGNHTLAAFVVACLCGVPLLAAFLSTPVTRAPNRLLAAATA